MAYLKKNKLLSPKATELKPIIYAGTYTDAPVECMVLGYAAEYTAVISVRGQLHCIDPNHLRDMQTAQNRELQEAVQLPAPEPKPPKERHKGKSLNYAVDSYVVLDLETTGLNPQTDKIIEIGAVKYRDGQEVDCYSQLIDPEVPLSQSITKLTGITSEMLEGMPTISSVLPTFLDFVGNAVIVGHNVNFDINFVYDAVEQLTGKSFDNDFVDTLKIARQALPDIKDHKLSTLVEYYGIEDRPTHRAVDDCRATAALYTALRPTMRKRRGARGGARA